MFLSFDQSKFISFWELSMTMSSIIFQFQSTIILGLLFYGASRARKNRQQHVKIMTSAIAWDLILVLQIELSRKAINTATQVTSNSLLMNYHISVAVTVVVLYGVLFYLGRQIQKSPENYQRFIKQHKFIGILTLLLRTSTYITAFMIKKSV